MYNSSGYSISFDGIILLNIASKASWISYLTLKAFKTDWLYSNS